MLTQKNLKNMENKYQYIQLKGDESVDVIDKLLTIITDNFHALKGQRVLNVTTGEYGAMIFHRTLMSSNKPWHMFEPLDKQELTPVKNFKYQLINGITLFLKVEEPKNLDVREDETGFPVESLKMFFTDLPTKEEKYYTPTIEEFHVGFEYELFSPTQTVKHGNTVNIKVFQPKVLDKLTNATTFNLGKDLEQGRVRVKYLDREDIESLGFKYESTLFSSKNVYKKDNLILTHDFKEKTVMTFTEDPSKSEFMMKHVKDDKMSGMLHIKNISELKRLLKQLKITV